MLSILPEKGNKNFCPFLNYQVEACHFDALIINLLTSIEIIFIVSHNWKLLDFYISLWLSSWFSILILAFRLISEGKVVSQYGCY